MLRTSTSSALVRALIGRNVLRKQPLLLQHGRLVVRPAVAVSCCNPQTNNTRSLHLPPLHRRFVHGRPRRLLHSPSDESEENELLPDDLDQVDYPRTYKVMTAGKHHTTATAEDHHFYDQDYDEYSLHMTAAQTKNQHSHEVQEGEELLQHDDVLSVGETRRKWDSDHYYQKDVLVEEEAGDYEYEMEEDWEIGRQEVETMVDPNDDSFVPALDDI